MHPHGPPAIDTWTRRDVANSATIIRTMAPRRSDQGARLKSSHQTRIERARQGEPSSPTNSGFRHDQGTRNLASHQQHGGDHAGPQPQRLPRGWIDSLVVVVSHRVVTRYSDLSACKTSTRDARAAGISEARTAAPTRTAAAPSIGSTPGRPRRLEISRRDARRTRNPHAAPATMPIADDQRRLRPAPASAADAATSRPPAARRTRACARSPRTPARPRRRPPR